jgi:TetR/AcrR family transcriptional regulator, tetracycline repressor protein
MPLERATMIRVGLTLLNEVGLDGLTVRRLAERLGVQNPALYWHFKKKQELLDEMARTMLADAFAGIEPPPTPDRWAEWLAEVAERFRLTLLTHRDGARVIATANLTGSPLLVIQELALRVLTAAGFDVRTALVSLVAIFDYTLGATFEEQADPDPTAMNRPPLLRAHILTLDPARFPHLAAALGEIMATEPADPNLGFKGGIRLLLAGMAAAKQTTSI